MEQTTADALPCKSLSPQHKMPCTKPDHHNRTEIEPTHRNGRMIWTKGAPEVPITIAQGIQELARGYSAMGTKRIDLGKPTSIIFTPAGGDPIDMTDMVSNVTYGAEEPGMTTFNPRKAQMSNPAENTELGRWWMNQADREVEATVPKAIEYGSTDLIDIGRNIARLSGRLVSDEGAAELGVFFYLEGKFARWRSAIIEGRTVSEDTLFDIGVYVRMAQRIRSAGGWPGVDSNKQP